MLGAVLRFFQRYAAIFSIMVGVTATRLFLPKNSPWWLELPMLVGVMLAVHWLLYKDGVSDNRQGPDARLRIIEIIGYSVLYWFAIWYGLLIILLFVGIPAIDWLPFVQGIDWPIVISIAALLLAAVVYAFGLRAAIRRRARHNAA